MYPKVVLPRVLFCRDAHAKHTPGRRALHIRPGAAATAVATAARPPAATAALRLAASRLLSCIVFATLLSSGGDSWSGCSGCQQRHRSSCACMWSYGRPKGTHALRDRLHILQTAPETGLLKELLPVTESQAQLRYSSAVHLTNTLKNETKLCEGNSMERPSRTTSAARCRC